MNEQRVLSLSAMSILGDDFDARTLKKQGNFIKKMFSKDSPEDYFLIRDITPAILKKELSYSERENFLKIFCGISEDYSISQALHEQYNGSRINHQICLDREWIRSLSDKQLDDMKITDIGSDKYRYYNLIMRLERYWPKKQLLASNIANGIMLVRIALGHGQIDDDTAYQYLSAFHEQAINNFDSLDDFLSDAARCLELQHLYLRAKELVKYGVYNGLMSRAYYGVYERLGIPLKGDWLLKHEGL